MTIRLLSLAILLTLWACGVRAQSQSKETFEFNSTYSLRGDERWEVNLNRAGEFAVKHDNDPNKYYGISQLTKKENSELWELIRVEKFRKLTFSDMPSGSCDTVYFFRLSNGTETHFVSIATDKARDNLYITNLVNRIRELVQKYAKVKPRF